MYVGKNLDIFIFSKRNGFIKKDKINQYVSLDQHFQSKDEPIIYWRIKNNNFL